MSVCLSILNQPHTVFLSRHFIKDVSFQSVLKHLEFSRREAATTLLLFGDACENAPLSEGEIKTC